MQYVKMILTDNFYKENYDNKFKVSKLYITYVFEYN